MKTNFLELIEKIKQEGYSEENAEAKLVQDTVLYLISKSRFNEKVTIKGGVVMRSISHNERRSTLDLDLDLVRYPLTVEGIISFIRELNGVDDITISIVGNIEDLKHQDYEGKRIFVNVEDSFHNSLSTKIDIGVHKYLLLEQINYCFDVATSSEGIVLLINSPEQMAAEKTKSLLRFGAFTTRFKDIYDIYYLLHHIDENKLYKCISVLIFNDSKMKERSTEDIAKRLELTFTNKTFLVNFNTSNKNWLDVSNDDVLTYIIDYFKR